MSLKQLISKFVPTSVKDKLRNSIDIKKLNALKRLVCDTKQLMPQNGQTSHSIFIAAETDTAWNEAKKEIDRFAVPDGTGGVNPGDRRAIFHLIRKFKPASILEAGTHIGASTIYIASALDKNRNEKPANISFTTVDIRDVNSTTEKPWLEYGTKKSPAEMINELNYGSFVKFIKSPTLDFFANSKQKFDLIFLDADHAAAAVYQEIPAALKALNPNGIILLHDFYPGGRPLWSNGTILNGPYAAIERLIHEGNDVVVLPLGTLPWPTKLNSNVTSLALLMRK